MWTVGQTFYHGQVQKDIYGHQSLFISGIGGLPEQEKIPQKIHM